MKEPSTLPGKLLRLLREPSRVGSTLRRTRRILARDGLDALLARLGGDLGLGRSIDYSEWVRRFDTPSPDDLDGLRKRAAAVRWPSITVCDPAGIGGLSAQVLPPLEVLTGPLQAALPKAQGEFVLVLDPRVRLPPHALLVAAETLARDRALDLLYADHDHVEASGQRHTPFFKPDFDPELLWSLDYVTPFTLVRAQLARAAPAQSAFGLFLRAAGRTSPRRIAHVPHILAHVGPGPAPSAQEQTATVRGALLERAPGWTVELDGVHQTRRVRPPLSSEPLVTAIVPTRDGLSVLARCVEGLLTRTRWPRLELLIVDHGSRETAPLRFLEGLAERGAARVLRAPGPFNFSRLNNLAALAARGEVLALCNNDLELRDPSWLSELVAHALRPEIGAVGAKLSYPDGRLQHLGVATGVLGVAGHVLRGLPPDAPGPQGLAFATRSVSAVTAACLVVRRELYLRAGGLDEARFAVAFNDIDFCLRLRAMGYRNVFTPWAQLVHHESYSRGDDLAPAQRARFEREIEDMHDRHADLARDPFYNPNLSLADLDLAPADPPRVARPWAPANQREP
ncbi:MAG: glycosyltransferase family 2 protein [Deltaproteobacteria bacterium]|nr:glycosyltransferase family 2 protein [Deltaproteobacteria bacterium]